MANQEIPAIVLSFKYRLLPTKRQHAALARVLEEQRQLYNAALEERIGCYRATGKGRSLYDQSRALTECRAALPDMAALPMKLQRWTLKRLDDAYNAFFRRVKAGGKPGFPRFRGKGWWRSFGFAEFSGIRFDGRRLRFATLPGGLRVHLHRPMPEGKPLSCVFTRDAKGWSVAFQMRVACAEKRTASRTIGIDVGLSSLATLSDGTAIPNPRHAKRAERELRRRSRALARCKRGSNRRKKIRAQVARLHTKGANSRATHLHQVSADLVNRFDLIAVEKLNVMGLAAGMLAKSVNDASWGRLRDLLRYKAEKAGAQIIEIDPRYTSQTCPDCGQVKAKALAERTHRCDCGCVMGRDHAAAVVILGRAVACPGTFNVGHQPVRAARNINLEGISG